MHPNERNPMLRRLLLPLALVALALAAAATADARTHSTPVLTGEVGPGFTIEVKKAGKDVKTLTAGTYRIKVEDKGTIHDFHLKGPGVDRKTGVSFTGTQTWTVKLRAGTFTYQCDPHAASGMKGTFKVKG
jgi:plastocyanin